MLPELINHTNIILSNLMGGLIILFLGWLLALWMKKMVFEALQGLRKLLSIQK